MIASSQATGMKSNYRSNYPPKKRAHVHKQLTNLSNTGTLGNQTENSSSSTINQGTTENITETTFYSRLFPQPQIEILTTPEQSDIFLQQQQQQQQQQAKDKKSFLRLFSFHITTSFRDLLKRFKKNEGLFIIYINFLIA
jgi:hypothetical protein